MERIRPSQRDLAQDYDEPAFSGDAEETMEQGSSRGAPAATFSRAKPPLGACGAHQTSFDPSLLFRVR